MRPVRVECRKWPDRPHWTFDAWRLGHDEHGAWAGIRRGTVMTRPGMRLVAVADHVTLVPYDDWWLGTFYGDDAERPFDTYVDVATPATWGRTGEGDDLVTAVDLDLDVIRGTTGRVWVDDEDEFAAHRVELDYPADVVAGALDAAERLEKAVSARTAPFDGGTAGQWLDRFRRRLAEPREAG